MSTIQSPISGRVIAVHVSAGSRVDVGDAVCTVESMKMEIPVEAEDSGVVTELLVDVGAELSEGDAVARRRAG
jgi:acetyl-CoA carboxylase biotin carboxyl carrier protein